jgi:hypothetical protein
MQDRIQKIAAMISSVITAGLAAYAFWPASLDVRLACHPTRLVMTAYNRGGQTAVIEHVGFKMLSPVQFPAAQLEPQPVTFPGARDPVADKQELAFRASHPYIWEADIYDDEVLQQICGFGVVVRLTNGSESGAICRCQEE